MEMIFECWRAVDRAMTRYHDRNPAGYHQERPGSSCPPEGISCPFTHRHTE